ncbi:MAG: serine acetyltransferase [Acetobacteraceae bacterium]|nr:serine acetyltransferase [Acetobacteraceae bacterium]
MSGKHETNAGALAILDVTARLHDQRIAARGRSELDAMPVLPSRDVVLDIVESLVSALFPRHFGPAGMCGRDLDGYVARTLDSALHKLHHQIELEIAMIEDWPSETPLPPPRDPDAIIAAFADALPGVRNILNTDIQAAFRGDPSAKSLDEVISCFPGVAALTRHRLAHELYRHGVTMLARIISESAHSHTGIDIHPGAQIGHGFFIDHGTGVVIGETAIIGQNVRLYQAVTLGAKRFEVAADGALAKDYPRHPILEDDVVIYSGATVLGRITIGKGSSIGGNVWLTHSVPPNSHLTQAKARNESFDDGAGI